MTVPLKNIFYFWTLVTVSAFLIAIQPSSPLVDLIRVPILLCFIFVLPGFLLLNVLSKKVEFGSTIIFSILLSCLTLYPATMVTVALEKIFLRHVFDRHLEFSLISIALISAACLLILKLKTKVLEVPIIRINKKVLLSFAPVVGLYCFLVFNNLGRANILLDEYDISYQAYNLIDGIADGRKSFLLSFNTHPPLVMDIKHYAFQIVNPNGLDTMADWQYRFPEAIAGLITLPFVYFLTKELFGRKVGLVATALLAVNNYHVWFSRFVEREIFLTIYMIGFIFCLKKIFVNKVLSPFVLLSGICLGTALLVKASGLILVPLILVPAIWISFRKKKIFWPALQVLTIGLAIFSPVIIFNLIMYFLTGYADSLFVRFLPNAKNPFATARIADPLIINPPTMFFLLIDLFSILFSVFLAIAIIYSLSKWIKTKDTKIGLILLWLIISLLFYIPNMVRAYYLHFVTVPAVILVAILINNAKQKVLFGAVFIIILMGSITYSYNSNLNDQVLLSREYDDAGRSGFPLLIPSLTRNYSLASRSWSQDWGWASAVGFFDSRSSSSEKFCITLDGKLDTIALRRYFWYKDEVKKHFTGSYGQARFPICKPNNNGPKGYLLTSTPLQNSVPVAKYGATPLYIYEL